MTVPQILKQLHQPEIRPELKKRIKQIAIDTVKDRKRNILHVEYGVLERTRTHSVDSDGKKIKMPGTVTDPESGSELTAWVRYPGETIILKNYSDKIFLLSRKIIMPLNAFIDFVQEHIDKTFSLKKLRDFDAVGYGKELQLIQKEELLKKKSDPIGYELERIKNQRKEIEK